MGRLVVDSFLGLRILGEAIFFLFWLIGPAVPRILLPKVVFLESVRPFSWLLRLIGMTDCADPGATVGHCRVRSVVVMPDRIVSVAGVEAEVLDPAKFLAWTFPVRFEFKNQIAFGSHGDLDVAAIDLLFLRILDRQRLHRIRRIFIVGRGRRSWCRFRLSSGPFLFRCRCWSWRRG